MTPLKWRRKWMYMCSDSFILYTGHSWLWSCGSWIYNYLCNQYLSSLNLWVRISHIQAVLDTSLCDKVCQGLETGQWFSPGTLVSSTNKTDRHDRTEILLKVALNNPSHVTEMWSIGCDIQVSAFLRTLRFPPPIKTDRHDITEILLKVTFKTNKPTL